MHNLHNHNSGTIGIFFSHKTETPHPMEKDNDLFSFVKVTPSNSIQWKLVLSLFVELLIGENKLFSWLFYFVLLLQVIF